MELRPAEDFEELCSMVVLAVLAVPVMLALGFVLFLPFMIISLLC